MSCNARQAWDQIAASLLALQRSNRWVISDASVFEIPLRTTQSWMPATRSCNISSDAFLLRGKRIEIDELRIVGMGLAVEPFAAMNVN